VEKRRAQLNISLKFLIQNSSLACCCPNTQQAFYIFESFCVWFSKPFFIRVRVNSSTRLLRQLLNVLSDYMALLDYDRLKKNCIWSLIIMI